MQRNGSSEFDGIFNIDTGARGNLGVLERWKFSEHTGFYPDKCGNVQNASAGDFFPRKLTHDSVIKMFTSDLCRYMELEFEEEVLVNNIVGYKYVAGQKFLDNGKFDSIFFHFLLPLGILLFPIFLIQNYIKNANVWP